MYFHHFCIDAQFFNRILSPLRELVAFCSTHAQDFNLFHVLYLLVIVDDVLSYYGKGKSVNQTCCRTEESNQSNIDKEPFQADKFADYKNAWKGNDRVRKKIG